MEVLHLACDTGNVKSSLTMTTAPAKIVYGYALAGYGTTFFGSPAKMDYVINGLTAGFMCGGLALGLWYWKRKDFFDYDSTSEK